MKKFTLCVLFVTVFFSVAASASVNNSTGDKYTPGSVFSTDVSFEFAADGVSPVALKDALTGKTYSTSVLVAERPPKKKAPGAQPQGKNPNFRGPGKNPNAPGQAKKLNAPAPGRNPNAKPPVGKAPKRP
ncbi:hypothetical protein [Candidatus Magnetomonas plexicatena]|uniref:hypothetical protein n=1 Tax=Candidatus Magnetomonas plexicatena TaxID=2552947 RepID=UPI001C750367|nr:hypothetical protein E2O03_009340 [Nitrospirales bacterium LBB_01]